MTTTKQAREMIAEVRGWTGIRPGGLPPGIIAADTWDITDYIESALMQLADLAEAGLDLRESLRPVRQGMPWRETWVCEVEAKDAYDVAVRETGPA